MKKRQCGAATVILKRVEMIKIPLDIRFDAKQNAKKHVSEISLK